MAAEPLIHWVDPIQEFAGFLALFLTVGAVGFREVVLRPLRRSALEAEREFANRSALGAARFACAGAVLSVGLLVIHLPQMAAERHVTMLEMFARDPMLQLQTGMRVMALAGFTLAMARWTWGWPVAALGVVVGLLRWALVGQWARLINPMHALAGGLWIGTLFFVVAAALPHTLRASRPGDPGEALTARLIGAFSPLALVSAAVLALFGVITAWRHLKHLRALWTTPYGVTLLVKLGVVASVLVLGAWNWKRIKPRLGSEGGTRTLQASARVEILVACVVLMVTAVLVSLPSP
jgi:putative copper export protein